MTHKILVIDDHPETLSIIRNVLEQHGYQVSTARSGFRGLSLAETDQPDLIMLDGMMPEMDGWEVCRRLRQHQALQYVPIIMFSAVEEAEQKLAGFDAGADDYLTKPTEPNELIERVEILLQSAPVRAEEAAPAAQPAVVAASETQHTQRKITPPSPPTRLQSEGLLIVALGARGGVGTTTLAINLAATLASRGTFTTLVDMDVVQGHIAHYLKQKPGAKGTTAQLSAGSGNQPIAYRENLQLLLTRASWAADGEETAVSQRLLRHVTALRQPEQAIVVDAGRAITTVNQPVLEQADQILVCLRPERVALSAARRLFNDRRHATFDQTPPLPVMFDFLGSRNIPQEAIESYLGHPLTIVIPVKMSDFIAASNKGIPLVELQEEAPVAKLFGQLAQKIVKT